jgi:hypothetical protein
MTLTFRAIPGARCVDARRAGPGAVGSATLQGGRRQTNPTDRCELSGRRGGHAQELMMAMNASRRVFIEAALAKLKEQRFDGYNLEVG